MSPNPWNARALIGLCALAVLVGVLAAYCQHHDDPPPAQGCGAAYALPTKPAKGGSSTHSHSKPAPPRPNLHKAPPRPAARNDPGHHRPPTKPHKAHPGHARHHSVDLDIDAC
jgi:hypothetical protein